MSKADGVREILTVELWRQLAGPAAPIPLDECLARADPALADGVRTRRNFADTRAALHRESELGRRCTAVITSTHSLRGGSSERTVGSVTGITLPQMRSPARLIRGYLNAAVCRSGEQYAAAKLSISAAWTSL